MKKKDINELKAKSIDEIIKKISDLEREKVQLEIELKMAKLKNVHTKLAKKRDIAKAKTILRIKQFAKEAESVAG